MRVARDGSWVGPPTLPTMPSARSVISSDAALLSVLRAHATDPRWWNLMFPVDRRWLVSTLWDDDWTCVGGTTALINDLMHHPQLSPLVRRVAPGQDATPPGYTAM